MTLLIFFNGLEIRRLAYAAFGEEAENQGPGEIPKYTYTGKEQDSNGLYYYGARYYDPVLARFITADTVYDAGPQGLNRYSYTLNNPIIYRDPTGHYIDADLDTCTYGECEYDEGPTASGNVTGTTEQITAKRVKDRTATVHNYYGTHKLSYWDGGLAGEPEPNMTNGEIAGLVGTVLSTLVTMSPDDLLIEPLIYGAEQYCEAKGYHNLKKAVFIAAIVASIDDGKIGKIKNKVDDLASSGIAEVKVLRNLQSGRSHFAIETISDAGVKKATHLEINELVDQVTIRPFKPDPKHYKEVRSVPFDLPDVKSAQKYQDEVSYRYFGKYNENKNSCLTHACNVLRAGGIDAPTTKDEAIIFLKQQARRTRK